MSFGYSAYIIIRLQDFRALRVSTSWRNTAFFGERSRQVFYRIKTTLQQRTILSAIC